MELLGNGNKVLAIDGDWLIFMIAFAALAEAKRKGAEHLSLPLTIKMLDNYISKLVDDLEARDYVVLLTGRDNFRKFIPYNHLPKDHPDHGGYAYKANRKGTELPPFLADMAEHLREVHGAYTVDEAEADDALGIWTTDNFDDTILVATDKDLDMIPGWHYNPRKKELYEMTEMEANITFALQLIQGDPVDNIPSLHKCFGVRNTKALKECIVERVLEIGVDTDSVVPPKVQLVRVVKAVVEAYYPDLNRGQLIKFLQYNSRLIWIHRDEKALERIVSVTRGKINAKTT